MLKIKFKNGKVHMECKIRPQFTLQERIHVQEFLDMIVSSITKFNTDHFICDNTFRCASQCLHKCNGYSDFRLLDKRPISDYDLTQESYD